MTELNHSIIELLSKMDLTKIERFTCSYCRVYDESKFG